MPSIAVVISYCIHYECTTRALIDYAVLIIFFPLSSMGSKSRSMVHAILPREARYVAISRS